MRQVHEHGDVVHVRVVNHHAYILSHPRDIETVLVSKSSNFIKSVFLRESKALFGDGLLTSEGGLWQKQRRALQPAFHHDHVLSYTRTMLESTARMLARWQDGEERDVHQDMTRLTMEIVAKVLFGEEITSDAEQACEAFGLFFKQYDERFGLYLIPEWVPTPENIRYHRSIKSLDEIVLRIIRRKVANDNGQSPDVLSVLLRAREGAKEREWKRAPRTGRNDDTLFFTGHETTALALAWTFYLRGKNPDKEQKLQAEVDTVLDVPARPLFQDLARLPFLEMIFKESLRLYPPRLWRGARSVERVRNWRISEGFFEEINQHPIPVGTACCRRPGQRSGTSGLQRLDRPGRVGPSKANPARIPLFGPQGLQGQLGVARYSRDKRFRQTIRRWLGRIKVIWPECPAEPSQDGKFLIVRSSRQTPAIQCVSA